MRNILFAGVLVIAAMFLVGCPSDEPDVLRIWSFTDELDRPIERFKELYPDVEVEFTVVPNEEYQTKLRPVLRLGSEAPDVFTGEAAYIKDFIADGVYDSLNDRLGADDLSNLVEYVVSIGTDEGGDVRALSWQSTPGGFFYRRSLAKQYLGTDDPDEVGRLINSFDGFLDVARQLRDQSGGTVKVVPGWVDLQFLVLAQRRDPWVVNGEFKLDSAVTDYFDIAKQLRDEDLEGKLDQWSPNWFESMKQDSNVFGFVLPTWGLPYVLKANAPDSSGDWAVTSGPAPYFWGGTWLGINKDSSNKEAAWNFVRMMTLDRDFLVWWAEETGDFLGNTDVVAEIQDGFSEPYLNGQNHYEYFSSQATAVNGELLTRYDLEINGFMVNAIRGYVDGDTTRSEAIETLKADVRNAYPDIVVN